LYRIKHVTDVIVWSNMAQFPGLGLDIEFGFGF